MNRSLALLVALMAMSGVSSAAEVDAERLPNGDIRIENVQINQICQYGLQFLLVRRSTSNDPRLTQVMGFNGAPLPCQQSLVPEKPAVPKK